MGRAPCCEKVGLKRGRWTAEEDEILINYIKKNGEGSWRSLPKNAGLLRCGKSCRLRWINYLRADLKRGNFTVEEEETIIKLHRSVGNRWSLIASHLPGRTDNEVKNYWNSHLSRKIYSFSSSNGSLVSSIDLLKMANSCKRRGGRVSRSVAKKYNKAVRPNIINGTQEFTATGNSKLFNARAGQNGARTGTQEFVTATEKVEVGLARDEIERGSSNSMHDSCREGQEVGHVSFLGSPKELGGDIEVLGPYEEPGDLTALLDQFFLSELSDLCNISINNEEKVNGSMAPESTMISEERSCEAWHSMSNSSSDSGLVEECFSPLNSYFEDEMAKLDMHDASIGFGLWD